MLRVHDLGLDARRKLNPAQTREVRRWPTRTESPAAAVARGEAVRLATRILQLDADLAANKKQLSQVVTAHAPILLDLCGIGPIIAAIVLSVWSHPGRIHHEAALARIGGPR